MPGPERKNLVMSGDYVPMPFPAQGLFLSQAFSEQPPLTAPVGLNVRTFEALSRRGRGGSRPGLDRWIDAQVNGPHLIQHLNLIVDPSATALTDYDPPGGVTGGVNPFAPSPYDTAGYPDPTEAARNPTGRLVRYGGTGIAASKTRKSSLNIEFVQGTSTNGGTGTIAATYPSAVGAGRLLLAVAYQRNPSSGQTYAVNDDAGNSWGLVGSYAEALVSGNYYSMSLWAAVAGGAATPTVTGTAGGDSLSLGIYEYKNNAASPLDGNGQDQGAGGASNAVDTSSIAVNTAGDMVFVAVATNLLGGSRIVIDDTALFSSHASGTFVQLFPFDAIPVNGALAFSGHISGSAAFPPWLAVGGSFKKA